MAKKTFVQTYTATIHYNDACGRIEKKEPITIMVDAENEEDARVMLYNIAKNAYLTFNGESGIIEVPMKKGKKV